MKRLLIGVLTVMLLTGCGGQAEVATSDYGESSVVVEQSSELAEVESEEPAQSPESEPDVIPTVLFMQLLRDTFSENGVELYAATLGSGWDQSTRCTTVVITKEINVWLFSHEKESEIFEVAIIGKYPSINEELELFAFEYAATVAAAVSIFEPNVEFQDAGKMCMEMVSELSDSLNLYVEREVGDVTCTLISVGGEMSFGIVSNQSKEESVDGSAVWEYKNPPKQ